MIFLIIIIIISMKYILSHEPKNQNTSSYKQETHTKRPRGLPKTRLHCFNEPCAVSPHNNLY